MVIWDGIWDTFHSAILLINYTQCNEYQSDDIGDLFQTQNREENVLFGAVGFSLY